MHLLLLFSVCIFRVATFQNGNTKMLYSYLIHCGAYGFRTFDVTITIHLVVASAG